MESLSQERLSESDIRVIEADLFGVTRIIKDRVFHEMYANSRNMSIKLLAEVKRLQAVEETVYDLEASVKLLLGENRKLREVIDKQHIQLDLYESLLNEGADTE